MEQYIPKDALVAEIERRISVLKANESVISMLAGGMFVNEFKDLLSFLDSLDTKEVGEPNASDRGIAEEIVINLKRIEQDYRIDLTKEIEWLRNKVKKGE